MAEHPSDPHRSAPAEEPERRAPATGTSDPEATELQPVEQPDLTGTLVFTLFFLMMVFGFWVLMYIQLLDR